MKKLNFKVIKKGDKDQTSIYHVPLIPCPLCGKDFSAIPGTRDAFCLNCGYKEPCCD